MSLWIFTVNEKIDMDFIIKQDIIDGLLDLGLKSGDEIEVHSSLSSF